MERTYILLFFIEFIRVTLVNKIIYISGLQFYNTPVLYNTSVYCIVCSLPQVESLPSPFTPSDPLLLPPKPLSP